MSNFDKAINNLNQCLNKNLWLTAEMKTKAPDSLPIRIYKVFCNVLASAWGVPKERRYYYEIDKKRVINALDQLLTENSQRTFDRCSFVTNCLRRLKERMHLKDGSILEVEINTIVTRIKNMKSPDKSDDIDFQYNSYNNDKDVFKDGIYGESPESNRLLKLYRLFEKNLDFLAEKANRGDEKALNILKNLGKFQTLKFERWQKYAREAEDSDRFMYGYSGVRQKPDYCKDKKKNAYMQLSICYGQLGRTTDANHFLDKAQSTGFMTDDSRSNTKKSEPVQPKKLDDEYT